MIKVAVCGALGKMGKEVVAAVEADCETELAASIDVNGGMSLRATNGSAAIHKTIEEAHKAVEIDVLVDFTQPKSIFENAKYCLNNGIKIVIGTTGLSDSEVAELKKLSEEKDTGCFIAPNFTTGALLMMKFAKEAAKYFDNAEIIELHHNRKKDAPSGTAIKTAQLMGAENADFAAGNCAEEELLKGSRGGVAESNIHIHSVRMPGYMASQEVLFGAAGQILSIRHDSVDRKCYMPGVLMAVKHVFKNNDFVYGLENIM
ncbi:MAG: 4-hydroxy-tetrahydrodipicolinate reductase [Heliobacteriaceae bacterium]|nr:4-hydroxy-tetrahydrodipicolinate reductase [Heliobacteriaceae bacterium]